MVADNAIHTLGGRLRGERRSELKELGEDRVLVVVDKLLVLPSATPVAPVFLRGGSFGSVLSVCTVYRQAASQSRNPK